MTIKLNGFLQPNDGSGDVYIMDGMNIPKTVPVKFNNHIIGSCTIVESKEQDGYISTIKIDDEYQDKIKQIISPIKNAVLGFTIDENKKMKLHAVSLSQ